jgi:hypothetical protein
LGICKQTRLPSLLLATESKFLPLALLTISLAYHLALYLLESPCYQHIFVSNDLFSATFRQAVGRGLPVHGRLRPAVAVRELPIDHGWSSDGHAHLVWHLSASSRMDGEILSCQFLGGSSHEP